MPKYSNQDVDVQELEASLECSFCGTEIDAVELRDGYVLCHFCAVGFDQHNLEPYPLEPELTGDDIEDAMHEFESLPLEDRLAGWSILSHAILTRGVAR